MSTPNALEISGDNWRLAAELAKVDGNWERIGLCADLPPDFVDALWFVDEYISAKDIAATAEAKRICGNCPVKNTCLEDALITSRPFGVRGGLTTKERAALVRKRARAAQAAAEPPDDEGRHGASTQTSVRASARSSVRTSAGKAVA